MQRQQLGQSISQQGFFSSRDTISQTCAASGISGGGGIDGVGGIGGSSSGLGGLGLGSSSGGGGILSGIGNSGISGIGTGIGIGSGTGGIGGGGGGGINTIHSTAHHTGTTASLQAHVSATTSEMDLAHQAHQQTRSHLKDRSRLKGGEQPLLGSWNRSVSGVGGGGGNGGQGGGLGGGSRGSNAQMLGATMGGTSASGNHLGGGCNGTDR